MNVVIFVSLLLIALVASSNGFSAPSSRAIHRLLRPSRQNVLGANKLDGNIIEGNLQPLSNNVLVKVKEAVSNTAGGLFIPDNAKERPTEGTVIGSGPGRVHPETGLQLDRVVNVGDSVIYGKYDGTELRYNDIDHQLIKDDDILLKFNGDKGTLENVQCVKDQVLVKLPPKEEKNSAGIIVNTPGAKEKRRDYGVVAKVGPGRQAGNGKYMDIQVSVGENVRFREFAGTEVKLEGVEYLVIRAYDILAKW